MTLLKALVVGAGTAMVAAILWVIVSFVLPIVLPMLTARIRGGGVGASAAVINSGSILFAALIGFAAGFVWMLRR